MRNTIDSFYVLYVLSTGIIDDVAILTKFIAENDWHKLPLQVHLISLAPTHLAEQDQDTQQLVAEFARANAEKSGWPQFVVHFYDKIKHFTRSRTSVALDKIKQEAIWRIPRDIESYLFRNKVDLSRFRHNLMLTNATQSQQYVMDIIDKKFEKLKD